MKPLEVAHRKPDLLLWFRKGIPQFNTSTKNNNKKKDNFPKCIFFQDGSHIFLTNLLFKFFSQPELLIN